MKHCVHKGRKPKLKSSAFVRLFFAAQERPHEPTTEDGSLLSSRGHASKQVHAKLSLHGYNHVVLHMHTLAIST